MNDTVAAASPDLFHAHVPFDEPPDLPFGIAVLHHPSDEIVVFLFGLAVLLRAERNHRQQVLDLREYPLFDHFADFFVRGPGWILAPVTNARPQRELHHLVAEILGIGDARGLLDLGQLLIEQLAIEHLSRIGVLEILILDPGIGVINVTVEQVLPVIGIGFEIGLLDFIADELGIAGREVRLDGFEIALLDFLRQLLAPDRMLQHIHQVDGVGADLRGVVIVGGRQNLEGKAGGGAVHALIDAGRGEFTEIETGKRADRPALAKALAMCRLHGARLVIAKLDRLSRNAHFLLGLKESGVDFVAADMPYANRLTVGIMAMVAEDEALRISERTKAALAAAKRRGVKLGGDRGVIPNARSHKASAEAPHARTAARAADLAPIIKELQAAGKTSLRAIAEGLNAQGIPTSRGDGEWTATQVMRVLERLDPFEVAA